MTFLEVRDLTVAYGAIQAVRGVSFSVERGQIVSLIGSNGAGKTTTLRTISGLLRPVSGSILLDGKPIHALPAHEILSLGVAHSPEGRRLFARMTVEEFARVLKGLAGGVRLETLKKHPRGPKKPVVKEPKNNKEPHVSTARLLEKRKRTG